MTEFFRADLHCHSTCSDGTYTPENLIRHAKEQNLNGLSITDHDTIDAYPIAIPIAKELGLPLISGAEFSAIQGEVSVHILAYAFDLNNPVIHQFCQRHQERRTRRNRLILEKLAQHQMPITEEEINLHTGNHVVHTIGRPHIALAMMKKGYVASVNDAFKKYLGEGKSCYASGESFSVEETIEVIHQAKGFAIIAHPHLLNDQRTFDKLLTLKFDGIEGNYANFNRDKNARWIRVGKKRDWIITGGSDFHGDVKPQIALGSSWVPEETFRFLENHYKEVNNLV